MNPLWLILAVAYLLGSIPFGLLIVKAQGGPDVRTTGSGNIGAANVARSAGAIAGVLTLLFDVGKGYLAVWIAGRWTGGSVRWMMAAAVAAVVGHVFPVWLRFRGGKGVATGLGVFLPICPEAVAAAAALWLIMVGFWRYSSLGSIVAAAALPVFVYVFYAPGHAPPTYVSLGTILISLLVLVKHRGNMERLVAGKEGRLRWRR
ncbi:MAG TPA: glycerol-3-phosphate 1-O-acyltransferase PlsY [Candidatus Acidoferrales bacterium]|nr:glycerol-3-phosphate 1-O-acyltransferase PlsY [Candidatus Acidoferrales bacterium]